MRKKLRTDYSSGICTELNCNEPNFILFSILHHLFSSSFILYSCVLLTAFNIKRISINIGPCVSDVNASLTWVESLRARWQPTLWRGRLQLSVSVFAKPCSFTKLHTGLSSDYTIPLWSAQWCIYEVCDPVRSCFYFQVLPPNLVNEFFCSPSAPVNCETNFYFHFIFIFASTCRSSLRTWSMGFLLYQCTCKLWSTFLFPFYFYFCFHFQALTPNLVNKFLAVPVNFGANFYSSRLVSPTRWTLLPTPFPLRRPLPCYSTTSTAPFIRWLVCGCAEKSRVTPFSYRTYSYT